MIIYILLGLISLALAVMVFILERRIATLTRGKNGSLEDTLVKILAQHDDMTAEHAELLDRHVSLSNMVTQSIRGVGFVKFNPFGDDTTKQSFALAFVDQSGNGVIVSTLYARERMSVFGKQVTNFKTTQELGEEEQQALQQAQANLAK